MSQAHDYDYLIVGSGFGGSVSALRLAEKGYRVAVLESGRRFEDHDFAERLSQLRRTIFAPKLGLKGILRVTPFKDVMILSGSGVGGGSLVYAQTLWRAGDGFFDDWRKVCGDAPDLEKYYELAEGMLGVVTQPRRTPADDAIEAIAVDLGVADTFRPVPVGVYFGEPGVEHADPYFGGDGPARSGCIECGLCLLGCRNNAKNTLPKNYLWFAERLGVQIDPERTVTSIRPLGAADGSDGYAVTSERTGSWIRKDRRTQTARRCRRSRRCAGNQPAARPVQGGWRAAADLRSARPVGPHQQRVDDRRDHSGRPRLGSQRVDHLEHASHPGQPCRSRHLRARRQRDGPDVHTADRRRHENDPAAEAARPDRAGTRFDLSA